MSLDHRTGLIALEKGNWNTDWVPPHTRVIEDRTFCALRSPVASGRFNSVVRCLDQGRALDARVAEIDTLYRGVDARFHFYPHRHDAELERRLTRIGFTRKESYEARLAETHTAVGSCTVPGIAFSRVETMDALRNAEGIITRVFDGQRSMPGEAELAHHLSLIEKGDIIQFVAYDETTGEPVGQAGVSFYRPLGIGLLFGGSTVDTHRQRGIYDAMIRLRAAECQARAIPLVGLWAHQDTSSPIVERYGFAHCGAMVRWSRPAQRQG